MYIDFAGIIQVNQEQTLFNDDEYQRGVVVIFQ